MLLLLLTPKEKLLPPCKFISQDGVVRRKGRGEERMILNLPVSKDRTRVRRLNWKQEFRRNVYLGGKAGVKEGKEEGFDDQQLRRKIERGMLEWMEQGLQEVRVRDHTNLNGPHSYYSYFLPLSLQSRFTDQLAIAIPTLKRLEEAGRNSEHSLLLMQITEYLRGCAERGEVDRGWLRCLRRYVCEVDSLRALELFLQVKKIGGVRPSSQLHRQFGGECLPRIFFERIQWCSEFFKERREGPIATLSLEANEEISQVTMPKTMKWLFCNICLLYDCNQHWLEDDTAKEKGYHYVAPGSIVPQDEQTAAAVTLFAEYQHLLKMGFLPQAIRCSPKCYHMLDRTSWDDLQKRRGALLSPMVKAVIKMGIHLFSFTPCQIWFLLADRGLTCALTFLFITEDYNLGRRLERRLQASEADALQRVGREEEEVRGRAGRGRGRRRMRVAHNELTCQISACLHYYLGDGVIDRSCQSCDCKQRGFCLPQCLCDNTCPIRKRGCLCRKEDCRSERCPCFKHNEQCDPYLCKSCFARTGCYNHQILTGRRARVRVGRSTIPGAGLGLFALQQITAGQLVQTYTGELIQFSIDVLRESLSVDNTFYNFSSKEGTIDARFMGNVARFINHADQQKENLYSQALLSEGRFKIAFFAKRNIFPHEELFFDYDGQGQLYANYKHKYPFINPKKGKKT